MAADKDLQYFNQTSGQWELVNSGAISDGTNVITPSKIGVLTNLTTSDKSSLTNAVNETLRYAQDLKILTLMGAI